MIIKDLTVSKEIDASEMSAVHGGFSISLDQFKEAVNTGALGPADIIALASVVDLSGKCTCN